MNEWFKKVMDKAKELWGKSSIVQKVILFAIAAAVIIAIVMTARLSSRPTGHRLFNAPVTDEVQRARILDRLDEARITATVSSDGYITVADESSWYRARSILLSENLVPSNTDPFAGVFDRNWSQTDADQRARLQRAMTEEVKRLIESNADVQNATVIIVFPETALFASDQNPVTASVSLRVNPSSDLLYNRRRLLGIQRLVLNAVEGLREENLVITDNDGNILNNFSDMAELDRVDLVARQQREIQKLETYYRARILKSLQDTLTPDRVRNLDIKIDMDMSKRTSQATTYSPIVIRENDPDLPYDTSEYRDTLPISQQTVTRDWRGTGFNPEGPAGTEGQTPPVYSDMSNVIGSSVETGVTQNNVINTRTTNEEISPNIDRVTVAVNIDGTWTQVLDPKSHEPVVDEETGGLKRTYVPVPREQLEQLVDYVQNAVGYDRSRNYRVTVTNIPFDRSAQFAAEDAAYFRAQQRRLATLLILASVAVILVGFIIFRMVSRELERRRRLREEELLRKQQEARERALWEARDTGVEVTMSVEESRREELQQNAIAMAKDHPEEVALLIRTWLMEES
ncbi:MAG: flagellar M-ring protein FliF [Treponema sp.]|nr:flagellar M-ring protein FliF [Treponema sp.]